MSVNDLAEQFESHANYFAGGVEGIDKNYSAGLREAYDNCASAIEDKADKWYPVSQPPTQEDMESCEDIVFCWEDGNLEIEPVNTLNWEYFVERPDIWEGCKWARIRDVVLLPF